MDLPPVPGSGRARLLEAALDLFRSKPYASVQVLDVARQAGVTTGSLYHHFGDKEGLYRALRNEWVARSLDRAHGARAAGGSARDILWSVFEAGLAFGVARILAFSGPDGRAADPLASGLAELLPNPWNRAAFFLTRILAAGFLQEAEAPGSAARLMDALLDGALRD